MTKIIRHVGNITIEEVISSVKISKSCDIILRIVSDKGLTNPPRYYRNANHAIASGIYD